MRERGRRQGSRASSRDPSRRRPQHGLAPREGGRHKEHTRSCVRGTDTREWTRGEAAFARKTAWYADLAASGDAPRPRSASLPSGPRSDAGVHNRRAPDGLWYTHVEPPLPNEDLDDERATGKPHFVPYQRPQTARRRTYADQLRADSYRAE